MLQAFALCTPRLERQPMCYLRWQVYVMPDPRLKGAAIGAQHPQWDVAYCAFIISISTPAQP
jgi:hypothetical protein